MDGQTLSPTSASTAKNSASSAWGATIMRVTSLRPIFRLTFTQNWGSQPFQNNFAIEHWERGCVGNYSVLWAKVIALDGTEYRTAYVAVKDEISIASCASRSFDIQPT